MLHRHVEPLTEQVGAVGQAPRDEPLLEGLQDLPLLVDARAALQDAGVPRLERAPARLVAPVPSITDALPAGVDTRELLLMEEASGGVVGQVLLPELVYHENAPGP